MKSKSNAVVWMMAVILGIMLISGSVTEARAAEEGQPQKLCPIMGNEINKAEYEDFEGKRVYFCCSECKKAFVKDPKKYINEMEAKGIVLDKAPCKKEAAAAAQGKCTK